MEKVSFSKILTYTCLAAITLAAAFLAVTTFANPASADPNGGRGNDVPLKSWDTDNLARWISSVGSVGGKNYRIPYHNYRATGYKENLPAKACAAYNIRYPPNGATVLKYRLLPQSETTRECPSGYSLVTQVCAYSIYATYGGYDSAGGVYVPFVPVPASYRVTNSRGTCDQISYTPDAGCYRASSGKATRLLECPIWNQEHLNARP